MSRRLRPHQVILKDNLREAIIKGAIAPICKIPVHRGQSFRRIADSVPVIADSF